MKSRNLAGGPVPPDDGPAAPVEALGAAQGHARAEELLAEARSESRNGSLERAWQACQDAAAIGRSSGDASILAAAAIAISGPQIAAFAMTASRQALCLEALAMLGDSDADWQRRVTAQLAAIASPWSVEPTSPASHLPRRDADERFTDLQSEYARALHPSKLGQRLAIATRVVDLGFAAADDGILAWGRIWRLDAFEQLGLRVQFNAELMALTAVIDRLGSPVWEWRLAAIHANLALLEDRLDDVKKLAAAAVKVGRVAGVGEAPFLDLILRAAVAVRTNDGLTSIEVEIRHAIAEAPFFAQAWRAGILIDLGREGEAIELWRALAPYIDEMPPDSHEWMTAMAEFARLSIVARDRHAARHLLDRLKPFAHLHISAPSVTPYRGPVALMLGRLAAFLGQTEPAQHWFAEASSRASAMNAPWWARAAQQERGLLEARSSPLTRREAEIAALVADGRTNREIAGSLYLSERTVEQHVRSILQKLTLPNRAAVAAWVARGDHT